MGTGRLFHPLALLTPPGVLLLLFAGLAYLARPPRQTMYWRGRVLGLNDHHSMRSRVYHWFFKP